jgi:hypothetical protein
METLKKKFLILICIVLTSGIGNTLLAQDCENLFSSDELKNELYTKTVRKNVFKTKSGKTVVVNAFFFGGKGYLLDFISSSGNKITVKLWNKDRTKVLFDSDETDGINTLQVSYSTTEKVLIEVSTRKRDDAMEQECIGLLIRTFDEAGMQTTIKTPDKKKKTKSSEIPTLPEDDW